MVDGHGWCFGDWPSTLCKISIGICLDMFSLLVFNFASSSITLYKTKTALRRELEHLIDHPPPFLAPVLTTLQSMIE